MKIAFATNKYDPRDIRRGSGTFYCMSQEMERQGHTVHYIEPLDARLPVLTRVLTYVSHKCGKKHRAFQDPFVGRQRGGQVTRKLESLDYDVLITNDYCVAGYAKSAKPVVLYTDAVFPRNYAENIHPWLMNLLWASVRCCQHVTVRALRRCDLCVFPAEWAVEEALRYGVIEKQRLCTIPFGANMDDPTDRVAAARSFSKSLEKGSLDLLFVGKDWILKGGEIAVGTVMELRKRGIAAVLHLVGAIPPVSVDPDCVKTYGLLDKSNGAERAKLDQLYRDCDVFILPSLCEGFVIAALEAAAYGLPFVAYDTRGVRGPVRNGETGILLKLGEPGTVFADVIERWFRTPSEYDRLVAGARKHYEQNVNWNTAVARLCREIHNRLCNVTRSPSPRRGMAGFLRERQTMGDPISQQESRYCLPYHWFPEDRLKRFEREEKQRLVFGLIDKHANGPIRRHLDVGCGDGRWTNDVRNHVGGTVQSHGVDFSERSIGFAKLISPEIEFSVQRGEALPFPEGTFDLTTAIEVIEHVEDRCETQFLRELHRVLVPQGLLLLTTPSLRLRLPDHHFRHYSLPRLTELLTSNGFSVLNVRGQSLPCYGIKRWIRSRMNRFPFIWRIWRFSFRETPPNRCLNLIIAARPANR